MALVCLHGFNVKKDIEDFRLTFLGLSGGSFHLDKTAMVSEGGRLVTRRTLTVPTDMGTNESLAFQEGATLVTLAPHFTDFGTPSLVRIGFLR